MLLEKVAFIILSNCSNKVSAGSHVAILQALLLMLVKSWSGLSLCGASARLSEHVGGCSVISWQ